MSWVYNRGPSWYVGWNEPGHRKVGKSCGKGPEGKALAHKLAEAIRAKRITAKILDLPTEKIIDGTHFLKMPSLSKLLPSRDRGERCFIYFVEAVGLDKIKIGTTSNSPRHRLQMLQNACPVQLKLLALVKGGVEIEDHIHAAFQNSRCHGEWFYATADLRNYISTLSASVHEDAEFDLTRDLRKACHPVSPQLAREVDRTCLS